MLLNCGVGKDSDAGRDWGQEEKGTTEDEMSGWHHRLDGHEFEWTPGVGDGQGGLACLIHGVPKSWTRLSDWIELKSRSELYWKNLYFPRKWRGRQILLVKHCERGEREAVHYTTGHQNCVIGLFFETSELTCVMNVVHGSSALWGWQVHKIVPKLKWSA